MSIKESGEMYLETIYVLSKKGSVRSVDVAEAMQFSRASVSRGIGLLKEEGFLTVDAHGVISLSEAGVSAAEKIKERHDVLSEILRRLGVDPDIAAEDACRIEHVISDETFRALKAHLSNNP